MGSFVDLSLFDVERVWADAKKLLSQVGLHVENPRLLSVPFQLDGGRVKIPEPVCDEMLRSLCARSSVPNDSEDGPVVDIFNNGVHFRYLDPETDEEKPWTVSALAEHYRFILQLGAEGVFSGGI